MINIEQVAESIRGDAKLAHILSDVSRDALIGAIRRAQHFFTQARREVLVLDRKHVDRDKKKMIADTAAKLRQLIKEDPISSAEGQLFQTNAVNTLHKIESLYRYHKQQISPRKTGPVARPDIAATVPGLVNFWEEATGSTIVKSYSYGQENRFRDDGQEFVFQVISILELDQAGERYNARKLRGQVRTNLEYFMKGRGPVKDLYE